MASGIARGAGLTRGGDRGNRAAQDAGAMTARSPGLLLHTLALCALACAAARAEEPPRSPACRTALEALERAEDALADAAASAPRGDAGHTRAVAARLQPLRKRVADACLGGLTTSPPPSQHTWVVPAPAQPAPLVPRVPMPSQPVAPQPLPRPEAPVTVIQCNAATCLASDGSTLTRVGPGLVGPRGACTVQGMFLRCP